MVFNSYIFIFLFLPLIIVLYFSINYLKKYRIATVFLLVMSLWFYGFANPYYLIFLVGSIIVNYLFHKLLENDKTLKIRKPILVLAILFNLVLLFWTKYYNFFIDSLNRFFGCDLSIHSLIIPLGISFVTFQQIAYIVGSYKKQIIDSDFWNYALFIAFFPHVLSGPILNWREFYPQIIATKRKVLNWNNFSIGLYMFSMGLGKKILIADVLGKAVNWGYTNIVKLNSTSAVFVILAYTMQIYFDFSGYSDMVIGIGKLLNFDFPINFNSPYKSITIIEFWKRWHITLTRFLTQYLYVPLGGNRKGNIRTGLNTMIVFFLSGLWHGASWTFVFWGLLHGVFLIITKRFKNFFDKIPTVVNWMITFLFINTTWILFRSGSFSVTMDMAKALLQNRWGKINQEISKIFIFSFMDKTHNRFIPDYIIPVIFLAVIVLISIKSSNVYEMAHKSKYNFFTGVWVLLILLLSILSLSGMGTFLYMDF